MSLDFIRKWLRRRTRFASQQWEPKNKIFKSNKFNYLDFTYKRYGNKNPNKYFFIIKRSPGAGFFSNLNFVIHNLYICDQLKMIPVIDMENFQTYYNCRNKIKNTYNSWEYYFKKVSKYDLKEVYKSKNVIFCDHKTSAKGYDTKNYVSNFKYFNGFQYCDQRHKKIFKKYIKIDSKIQKDAKSLYSQFKNKKVLGICFRGSDSKKNAYQPHTPTKEQIMYATKKLLRKYNFDKIYLCTEDENYLNFFKKKFSDFLIYNKKTPRTTDKIDLFNYSHKNHRYLVGRENIVDVLALSKANHLLFSVSNIPYTALFLSPKKIMHSVIDNGMRGGVIKALFSTRTKELLPHYLGGFKNHIITKNNIIKPTNSDFIVL